MTWPLARCLDSAVSDPGDPFINTWILDWDVWATRHQPLSLFHANVLHPARYSLAFSENLYGLALLLMPFRAAGATPLAAYNIGILLGFAFSGFAAYVLGRMLTASWIAGFAAGVFYAFVPFRFTHLPHIQHVWGGWLALLPAALLWYAARPSWKRAAAFGLVFLMNGLTNIHWLLFGSLAIALTIVVLAIRGERRWLPLVVATVIAFALLAPFLYPYHAAAKLYGAERTWEETLRYSATLRDWIFTSAEPERRLFPGFAAILLSILGARAAAGRAYVWAVWIVIGVLGSLGLNAFFHAMLFNVVPGFRAIRAPARWAAVAYIGMAMLIALAASRRKWIGVVATIALLFELRQAPIRWYSVVAEPREVDTWLASTPTTGAIIELPIDVTGSEAMAMFRATAHHKPIVNGVSGFVPQQHERIAASWPGDAFVDELARAGVELIVVHADAVDARDWLRRELDRGRIRFVRRFNGGTSGDWVFSLRGPHATSPDLEAFL
ncbi:MAG TPA: hypothetical protein VN181_00450, partial [Thermoanaerobaculia bacterium]|nr:hypothetical protein [Thermoanaerobaculia bacterium]